MSTQNVEPTQFLDELQNWKLETEKQIQNLENAIQESSSKFTSHFRQNSSKELNEQQKLENEIRNSHLQNTIQRLEEKIRKLNIENERLLYQIGSLEEQKKESMKDLMKVNQQLEEQIK